MAKFGNKRKRLLIEPQFQKTFLLYTLGIALTVVTIFFVATRFFFWKFKSKGVELGLPSDHIFFKFITEQQIQLDYLLLISSLVVMTVVFFYGLYMSNRVAGPIYHLREYLRKYLADEASGQLRFRDGDYFQEVAYLVSASLSHASRSKSSSDKKKPA
ncbi:MAG: hypothetical protein AABZ55_10480 [Bdellovibrionota bacterium]